RLGAGAAADDFVLCDDVSVLRAGGDAAVELPAARLCVDAAAFVWAGGGGRVFVGAVVRGGADDDFWSPRADDPRGVGEAGVYVQAQERAGAVDKCSRR